jgi:oligoribonuclease
MITKRNDLLVWVDLETTGLDPERDVVLEVALQLTDWELVEVGDLLHFVIARDPAELRMNRTVWRMHEESGLLAAIEGKLGAGWGSLPGEVVNTRSFALHVLYDHVAAYCERGTARLAGSSVHFDRKFLARYFPGLLEHLHYRQVDVSSVKELVKRWYGQEFQKQAKHRAAADLQESIAELRWLRRFFADPDLVKVLD